MSQQWPPHDPEGRTAVPTRDGDRRRPVDVDPDHAGTRSPAEVGVAAPPDEAGHLGSFTRPEDTLDASGEERWPAPDLHRDVPPRRDEAHAGTPTTLVLAMAVVAFVILVFFIYALF